jgi:phasin family protein
MTTPFQQQFEQFVSHADKSWSQNRQLFDIGMRSYEQMIAFQFGAIKGMIDHGVAQARILTEAKDVRDLLADQVELNRLLADRMVASGRELSQLGSETRDAYRTWFDSSLAEVREDLNQAAQKMAA